MSNWEEIRALFNDDDVARMQSLFDLSDCHAVAARRLTPVSRPA